MGCQSEGHGIAMPARVVASVGDEVSSTRRTVVGCGGFGSGNVHAAVAFYARICNDDHTVRTEVEIVYGEVTEGFELFVQVVLVDDRLTTVARFHNDTCWPM